ncbi:Sporulation and spore germination [Cetobacterium ceti]|uniref:Sporulation and spore germination n=1 Tax=Cetobacterium ceti TaxID=180163 RepID=A0A1T4NXG6_9FUSO|nr:GerMN domain-containing protein [Cetobacterium ceti]SJZ83742.1 Sporulation and spore germination [Cetobacterium ceti]
MNKKLMALCGILVGIAVVLGVVSNKINQESATIKKIPVLESKRDEITENIGTAVYIYMPNDNRFKLTKTAFDIKDTSTREAILKEVSQGVIDKLMEKGVLSKDEKYESTGYLDGKDLYLDLSSNIFAQAKSAKEEVLIIYSFVNTFCGIDGIDRVKFIIDGRTGKRVNFINIDGFYKANMVI